MIHVMSIPLETYSLIDQRQAAQRRKKKGRHQGRVSQIAPDTLHLALGSPSQRAGSAIELQAQQWLENQGLCTIARNLRIRRLEIDLLMTHGPLLVVVEVRSRARASHGSAADTIDWRKRQKLTRAVRLWQQIYRDQRSVRFDVILKDGGQSELRWIPGAFEPISP